MGGGPPGFPRGFTCPAVLRIPSPYFALSLTGVLPSLPELSSSVQLGVHTLLRVLQPRTRDSKFDVRHSFQAILIGLFDPFELLVFVSPISNLESRVRFGLFPFRSPLLRESIILSLPPGT